MLLFASEIALAMADPFGLWHNHHGDPSLKDSEDDYDRFLAEQGLRIEQELLLRRHPAHTDLKQFPFEAALEQTADVLSRGDAVIYGGALKSDTLGLRGRPDVIAMRGGVCVIEEYKLAGAPEERHKLQASVYAYILKKEYGLDNTCCVVSRLNEEFLIPYDETEVEAAIRSAREILSRQTPPYPVYNCPSAWGTLQNKTAKDLRDITLVWNIGAVHAQKFHQMGIHTIEDLARLTPESLRAIKGLGPKKVPQILNSATAQLGHRVIKVGQWTPSQNPPELELFLDLEGTGELFQDDPTWNCIYLIGLIPRRNGREEPYIPWLAKRPEDEQAILREFLAYLRQQTSEYRLYHWHHYEKTQLRKTCERYGLQHEYESLILPHLVDLCTAAQESYVLPTPGWSIKVVAPHFKFQWTQQASEVDAMKSAMIWYKQAQSGADGAGLEKVLQYNRDDCQAMIVVKDGFSELERADEGT